MKYIIIALVFAVALSNLACSSATRIDEAYGRGFEAGRLSVHVEPPVICPVVHERDILDIELERLSAEAACHEAIDYIEQERN